MTNLTHERLLELLTYNPETGELTWNVRRGGTPAGSKAGSVDDHHYNPRIKLRIDYKMYVAHRVAWFYMTKNWPKGSIDHINRNPMDNRFVNLREATATEQCQNRGPRRKVYPVGVYKQHSKYFAVIRRMGKAYRLGYTNTPEDAHQLYLEAAEYYKIHGKVVRRAGV